MSSIVNLYNEDKLDRLRKRQVSHGYDIEEVIPMTSKIDLSKPFVPLDEEALFFPGASAEQRLAISQAMGLVICVSTYEMEECLIRLRYECWDSIYRAYPVSPEFIELGERFFEEEKKHSETFKRFVNLYAQQAGLEVDDLLGLLPCVEGTKSELFLKRNMQNHGQCFWWIVAGVEQQFLSIYHAIHPFADKLDPLYHCIHRKHFEEEALHASFPYLMLELLNERNKSFLSRMRSKFDLATSQALQLGWSISSLNRFKKVKDLAHKHPFYETLASCIPLFEKLPPHVTFWKIMTQAPYVSGLVNPTSSRHMLRYANRRGTFVLPFPLVEPIRLEDF